MKVLLIPYGTDKAPATRYRVTAYLPFFEKMGIEYNVFPAISTFSTSLMINSPDFIPFARFVYYVYVFVERLVRSLCIIVMAKGFDIIFLQRSTFPLRLELALKLLNSNIVFDIDDAIYLPDTEGSDFVTKIKKYIKKSEVINILKVSKYAIVENGYIRDFVSRYCKNILKIPGPIDTGRFFVKPKEPHEEVLIGWIGSPATTFYLHMLDGVFKEIKRRYNFVKFKFVGLGNYANPDIVFENIEWKYETEVNDLQNFDIGIMPMPDNEWTRGKLGCKMLQYMAVGVPAVVSYTPTNNEIIEDGTNGFFARTEKEWIDILSRLIEGEDLRLKVGKRGRETILERCSLSDNVETLVKIFSKIDENID